MKIVIDGRFWGIENGGLGRYTMSYISELSKIDKENSYYILLRKKYFEDLTFSSNFTKVLVDARHYSLLEQIIVPLKIYKILPDVVHFLHFNVPLLYFGRFLVTIHDLLMHYGEGKKATFLPKWKFIIKRIFYRVVFDNAVANCEKIIVPSNFVKNDICKEYQINPEKVKVIYEGVKDKPANKIKTNLSNYFIYAGNAYPHKNIDLLLKAIKNVPSRLLLIVPKDTFLPNLQATINKNKLNKKVILKSELSDSELYTLFNASNAFVYPSFSEGFGLQGIEAMKWGTRLIASDISVFREVYENHAIYFDPHSKNELVKAMKFVIAENKKKRARALFSAISFVDSRYSWNTLASKTRLLLTLY